MKTFCGSLREHAMNIINFDKKKNDIINKQTARYENAKICYICKERLKINILKIKNIVKLEIIVIIQVST